MISLKTTKPSKKQSSILPPNQQNSAPSNLGNGHIETLIPYLFRPTKIQAYDRERIDTPDNDFLDLDWVKNGNKSLAVETWQKAKDLGSNSKDLDKKISDQKL